MENSNNTPANNPRTPQKPAGRPGPGRAPRPQFQRPKRFRPMSSRPAHPRRGKQHIEHKSDAPKKAQRIMPPAENAVRIIPLGGVE